MNLFLKIYYSLLFYVLYIEAYEFINFVPPYKPQYVFFAKPLIFFPVEIHSFIFLLALFLCLFLTLKTYKGLQILTALLVLILVSIINSYGKIMYNWHVLVLSVVLVLFFNKNQDLNSKQNFFVLRLIQGLLLSHYFMSGLWKLRKMASAHFEFSLYDIVGTYIAYTLVPEEGGSFIVEWLIGNPWLLSFSYVCVLIFLLSSLTPIFLNKYFKFYGILAILFHLATGISMEIYFFHTIVPVLYFFIIAESMIEYKFERRNSKLSYNF